MAKLFLVNVNKFLKPFFSRIIYQFCEKTHTSNFWFICSIFKSNVSKIVKN